MAKDSGDGRPTTETYFGVAIDAAMRAPARHELHAAMVTENRGRPRKLEPLAYFTLVHATALGQRPLQMTEVLETYRGLNPSQREQIGQPSLSYNQLTHFLVRVRQLVEQGRLDPVDLMNGILEPSLPRDVPLSLAADSTDYESWGRIRAFWNSTNDAAPTNHEDSEAPPADSTATRRSRSWPVLCDDGRLQRTADPDARDGHRSARNNRSAGAFVGYDLTLLVNTRPLGHPDPLPGFIAGANLTSAGSHHAKAALEVVQRLVKQGQTILDVAADRAYNMARTEFWTTPLRRLGIDPIFDLASTQRGVGIGPVPGTLVIDGTVFTTAIPERLRKLPHPTFDMTSDERSELAHKYDERMVFAYKPMTTPGDNGKTRYRGPVRPDVVNNPIRCPNHPHSMRAPQDRFTTDCSGGKCGCSGTFTRDNDFMPNIRQRTPYGTTAWNADYHRRNAVESANSNLRRDYSFDRGYTRVFGRIKNAVLLGFLIFAHNYSCITKHFLTRGKAPTC